MRLNSFVFVRPLSFFSSTNFIVVAVRCVDRVDRESTLSTQLNT